MCSEYSLTMYIYPAPTWPENEGSSWGRPGTDDTPGHDLNRGSGETRVKSQVKT